MQRARRRSVPVSLVLAAALGLAACSGYAVLEPDPGSTPSPGAVVAQPAVDVAIGGTDPGTYAVAASREFFDSAALVVLAADNDADRVRAASLAFTLGVPALVEPGGDLSVEALVGEFERLDTRTVLLVGEGDVPDVSEDRPMLRVVPAPEDLVALQVVIGHELEGLLELGTDAVLPALADLTLEGGELVALAPDPAGTGPTPDPGDLSALPGLPSYVATARAAGVLVVAGNSVGLAPAVGTARAAGADALVFTDPAGPTAAEAAGKYSAVVATLGAQAAELGSVADAAYLARVAVKGQELPGGGLHLLGDGRIYAALRGLPGVPEFGPASAGVVPAVAQIRADTDDDAPAGAVVVPTLELVTTVVTAEPGADGTYVARQPLEVLREAVTEAGAEGAMVLLGIQPGRESFVTLLEAYGELLAEPNVGVLLEPQWRLGPQEVPGQHAGAVGEAELRETAEWLAQFTRERSLPPKLFAVRSPADAAALAWSGPELGVVAVVDGSAVAPAIPTPEGEDPAQVPPVPAVTARQVWAATVVPGDIAWGWEQGQLPAPLSELFALDPEPALIILD